MTCYYKLDAKIATYRDVILTDYFHAVSMDASISTALSAKDVSALRFIVTAFMAEYCFVLVVE